MLDASAEVLSQVKSAECFIECGVCRGFRERPLQKCRVWSVELKKVNFLCNFHSSFLIGFSYLSILLLTQHSAEAEAEDRSSLSTPHSSLSTSAEASSTQHSKTFWSEESHDEPNISHPGRLWQYRTSRCRIAAETKPISNWYCQEEL